MDLQSLSQADLLRIAETQGFTTNLKYVRKTELIEFFKEPFTSPRSLRAPWGSVANEKIRLSDSLTVYRVCIATKDVTGIRNQFDKYPDDLSYLKCGELRAIAKLCGIRVTYGKSSYFTRKPLMEALTAELSETRIEKRKYSDTEDMECNKRVKFD